MIRARSLNKTYSENGRRVTVFQGLDLDCRAGEYLALMGPSGAGKTSLLQLLGCLDRPDEGSYELDGELVSAMGEEELAAIRNHKIGFVFQTNHFVDYLDLVENVALPGRYADAGEPAAVRERAVSLLRDLGLEHRLDHLPGELSGGERQRAALARALYNRPRLILADEPTGNLDAQHTQRTLALLEAVLDPGIALILVTHDRAVAARAQHILELREGCLQELSACAV